MKINKRGYWENNTAEGHGHDKVLADALVTFFLKELGLEYIYTFGKVIDIGCGDGYYVNYLRKYDIYCEGFDGNPNTPLVTKGLCKVADFSKPTFWGDYHWVLCLEVGEHIPEKYEDIFIQNLVDHAITGIVLSWAVPGQGGDGHVNCKTNDYIRNKICNKGFKYDVTNTNFLRKHTSPYPQTGYWFKNTIMVFRRF